MIHTKIEMPFFRKLPVVVEARCVTGPREMGRAVKWMAEFGVEARYRPPVNFGPEIDIPTLEGMMTASVGDWIVRGIKNKFYPCKPKIFEATFEPVADISATD